MALRTAREEERRASCMPAASPGRQNPLLSPAQSAGDRARHLEVGRDICSPRLGKVPGLTWVF